MMNPEKPGYEQGAPPAYPEAGAPPQGGYAQPPQGGYAQPPQGGYAQPPQGGYAQPPPATVVVTQPAVSTVVVGGPAPNSYLIPSILVCLFCFWPTGICAIYYALQSNTFIGQGNYTAAAEYSRKARLFTITSIVVGVVWIAIVVIIQIVAAASVSATYSKYNY